MKIPKLTVVIEKEDDRYVATCPELDVASKGRTVSEADAMLHDAILLLLEEANEVEVLRRLNRYCFKVGSVSYFYSTTSCGANGPDFW